MASRYSSDVLAPILFVSDTEPNYTDDATDSSKNEKHGDGGRNLEKTKGQREDLDEAIKNAPNRKEKKLLKIKQRNIKINGEKKRKGEEHHR